MIFGGPPTKPMTSAVRLQRLPPDSLRKRSVLMTQRYLGCKQNLEDPVNDRFGRLFARTPVGLRQALFSPFESLRPLHIHASTEAGVSFLDVRSRRERMVNRRTFLRRAVATTAFLIEPGLTVADPLGLPIGCQTYPVRREIQADFVGTMQGLR